ncbi:hypothetical protein OMW55_07830 [Sphingomonas sp. BN140010]|uniref:Secreted protein n=1 Tax=Sphingomonas arvum TaxID=2992113 RepID=A0ABT3JFX2_9SPHN|nr:hypothetical protein [Sphingomonas sp. BN140010]MCW3797711.1 hypothetical protein [Sphingomonas sp. BN140010]
MFSNRLVRRLPVALLLATAAAGTANAATDGSLGTTSTGSVAINASVAGRVQISGLRNVTFSAVDPGAAIADNQDVCVWSNTAGRKYKITASGSGTGGAFKLASSGLTDVDYSVEWNQAAGANAGTALTNGSTLAGQASLATAPTCSSGPIKSASLIVRMDTTNLQNMQAGATYTGTLTLVVAPE